GTYLDVPFGNGLQHRFKISLLGPSYKSYRVILSLLLIVFVISARSVGAAYLEGQFLFIKIRPANIKPYYPHQNNTPSLSGHFGGLGNDFIAFIGGGDDDRIGTYTSSHRFHVLNLIGTF